MCPCPLRQFAFDVGPPQVPVRKGRFLETHSATELDGIAEWTVVLMERLGGLGAGLAIFIETLFPPIPSEVVLPMAGFAARLGPKLEGSDGHFDPKSIDLSFVFLGVLQRRFALLQMSI